MLVQTRAIVLSSLNYAEADLIVRCYTRDAGIQHYLLRGIRKSRRGKLRTAMFQLLTVLEIEAFHKGKGNLERIREARVILPYSSLHTHPSKQAMVMFLAEMLSQCLKETTPDIPLFDFLVNSLIWLDSHDRIGEFHLLFLLELTRYLGFYPDTSNMQGDYFNLQDGRFEFDAVNPSCETGDSVAYLKTFFGTNFDALEARSQPKKQRLQTLQTLLAYYQYHLQEYKEPKTLPVLVQLFR